MSAKSVRITSHDGQVDYASVNVSLGAGEEIVWSSYGSEGAIVVFASPDGSPFLETAFHVPAGGSVSSGPVQSTAEQGKPYKYIVVGHTGANDPVVIIDP